MRSCSSGEEAYSLAIFCHRLGLDVEVLGASARDLFRVGTLNMSVAVWVGMIALVGIATDDGVVMATYLDQVFTRRRLENPDDIRAARRAEVLPIGIVAPGDDPDEARAALASSGAARILSTVDELLEILP